MRIAMWSGPRNLSTALMRSFSNHPSVATVLDEPLYAAYLAETGKAHPMRKEIMCELPTGWPEAIERCLTYPDDLLGWVYQKHMTHHILPDTPRNWIGSLVNLFLIRDPRRVVASYAAHFEAVTLDDLGFRQQSEIFDQVCEVAGTAAPVVDAEDIRKDPEGVLPRLCIAAGLDFDRAMLSWAPGKRADDGVWGAHWYNALEQSTGFAPPDAPPPPMTPAMEALAEAAQPFYTRLSQYRI